MAFATIGLTADSGASWTLPRLIGYGRAMELMLLAKPVTADRALQIGMVTEVADDALATAQELASSMAAGPTTGYGKIKEALLTAAGADLEAALAKENEGQSLLGATADHREAVDAFVAKRPATFKGH
jgi:2-(1,2-epoxy-1,2-dihydrophenyl)acetyl-CoA isomerase